MVGISLSLGKFQKGKFQNNAGTPAMRHEIVNFRDGTESATLRFRLHLPDGFLVGAVNGAPSGVFFPDSFHPRVRSQSRRRADITSENSNRESVRSAANKPFKSADREDAFPQYRFRG